MGYNAHAYAVVGLPIPSKFLFTRRIAPAFKHDHPRTMKFCPNTGKALWTTETIFVDGTEYDDMFHGFDVLRRSSEDDVDDPETINFVGKQLESCGELFFWSEKEIADIKYEMKEKFTKLKLWNEGHFGVYPVLYESC